MNPMGATARSSRVDLRDLEYVSNVDSNVVCTVCHCPFINPRMLECDHVYCSECLEGTFATQLQEQKTCPTCRKPALKLLPVPRFLTNLLEELLVACPNQHLGCSMNCGRGHVVEHVDNHCLYTEVPCASSTCDLMIAREFSNDDCLHFQTTCSDCHQSIMEKDMEKHKLSECEGLGFTCALCGTSSKTSNYEKHLLYCPRVVSSCSAVSVGCNFSAERDLLSSHESSCPLVAILPSIQKMRLQIEAQNEVLINERIKVREFKAGLLTIQALLGITNSPLPQDVDAGTRSPLLPLLDSLERSASHGPFDSVTHHLLSLHEALCEEVARVSAAVSELDARSSMMLMNDALRVKDDLAHTKAAVNSMRMQLQWLTSAKLQSYQRPSMRTELLQTNISNDDSTLSTNGMAAPSDRRLSDSLRQDTKL